MSCVGFEVPSGVVATTTSAKTILQVVAAANHAVRIDEFGIGFQGTSNTAAPGLLEVVRQSDAGTSSAATVVKQPDDSDETLQTTARKNCTAEPTTGDVLMSIPIHPQTGFTWQAQFGKHIKVGGGDRLGLRVTFAADVNCCAYFKGEE